MVAWAEVCVELLSADNADQRYEHMKKFLHPDPKQLNALIPQIADQRRRPSQLLIVAWYGSLDKKCGPGLVAGRW